MLSRSRIIIERFLQALYAIDAEAATERSSWAGRDYRPAVALFLASFCLIITHYPVLTGSFERFLLYFPSTIGLDSFTLVKILNRSGYYILTTYVWRLSWIFVGFVFLPIILIKLVFKESIRDYGLGVADLSPYVKWIALLVVISIIFAIIGSYNKDVTLYYPFYTLTSRSWADLILWEFLYFLEMICVEFFFRGFLLKSCKASFGFNAIFVMSLPYMMIHLNKPFTEAVFSVFFGILLGILALRSRSIWGCVIIHYSLALTADIAALIQKNILPGQWWP